MRMKQSQFHKDSKTRQKRMAWSTDYIWPKSGSTVTIPYTTSGVNDDVIKRAAEVFKSKTCIRMVERGSERNYLAFQSGSACITDIGYRASGAQAVKLRRSCAKSKGKVMHEIMHSLGFMHEQCRPDRNSYITIHSSNIQSGAESEFAIQAEYIDQGIPYDCESILHYRGNAFSKNGQDTITSTYCSTLGNDDKRLSLLDYKRINKLYGCDDPTYRYFTVKVTTDDSWLSGTDCYVYMKLHGSRKTSSEFELDLDESGSSDLFEKGTSHTFKHMVFRDDLGPVTGISIRMVAHGSGKAWWPNLFVITDPVNNQVVKFGNTKWLEPPSTYGPSTFPRK